MRLISAGSAVRVRPPAPELKVQSSRFKVQKFKLVLLDRIRRYAARHSLWTPGTRVVAAVSGGSDSVALFHLLRELSASGDLDLAGLAHLNHRIRGAEADEDALFCRQLAEAEKLQAFVEDADVPAEAQRSGVSIEVAGRQARQRFFLAALPRLGADRVAVAHTRDDQAETVLLRLTRGAGATGLAGIAPRRDHLIRPVLELTRDELRQFLRERGETWRDDPTNDDRSIPRNLVRHEVLPRLRQINARVDDALARTAEILRLEADFLGTLANEAAARCVRTDAGDGTVRVNAAWLSELPTALSRRVALMALETANPGRSYGLEDAQSVCDVAEGHSGGIPSGVRMERSGAEVVLVNRATATSPAPAKVNPGDGVVYTLDLDVPGSVRAPQGGWTLSAEGPMSTVASREAPADKAGSSVSSVVVDAGTLRGGLIVRPRRPGDRLHPLGAPGRKKVQDVFVDRKVPRDERDNVPIVTDKMGEIVWVAGQVLAEPFRVTPLTTTVVVLTLRRE